MLYKNNYFICDHAGSVRVVADMWGRAEQINHYYPYGLTFADEVKSPDHQPYKFGGKELDAMSGMIVEYANDDSQKEEALKFNIQVFKDNSQIFREIYNYLESSTDVFIIKFGETSDLEYGDKATGEFNMRESSITFDHTKGIPSFPVISEEFYHAYQEVNKHLNLGVWNREFEAKVITSVACGESECAFPGFPGMEDFSNYLARPPLAIYAPSFAADYLKAGQGFASYYSGKVEYGNKVDRVPQTFFNLINKLK